MNSDEFQVVKPLRCHLGRCIGDEDGSVVTFGCIEKCGPGAVGEIAPRYDNSRDALVNEITDPPAAVSVLVTATSHSLALGQSGSVPAHRRAHPSRRPAGSTR